METKNILFESLFFWHSVIIKNQWKYALFKNNLKKKIKDNVCVKSLFLNHFSVFITENLPFISGWLQVISVGN